MPKSYPKSFKDRAVRMVADRLEDEDAPSQYSVFSEIAPKLGVATETLRRWFIRAEVDAGNRPGVSSDEHAEIRRLKKENAELRRANAILKTAAAFVAAEHDRPTTRGSDRSICIAVESGATPS